jgi:hypothetical protein
MGRPKLAGYVPYALRLPADLKTALEQLAEQNARSLNAEIVWQLKQRVEGYRK